MRGTVKTDWSSADNQRTLQEAVNDWDNHTGHGKKDISYEKFGACYSIPKVMHMCMRGISSNNCCGQGTMYNYARNDKEMRTAISSNVGKPRIMSADNEQLMVDVVRRADRGKRRWQKLEGDP